MKEIECQVSFNTPAFLGNADQVAQWRTPPFKTLIRQWWRIVKAPSVGYDHQKLLEQENALFGRAADKNATRSALRLRLSPNWEMGTLSDWKPIPYAVQHPEVKDKNTGKPRNVPPDLYLGFGPIEYNKITKKPDLSTRNPIKRTAIEPQTHTGTLWLGFPDAHEADLNTVLSLISWFGTLGCRSRNGWGSLSITAKNHVFSLPSRKQLQNFIRPLEQCLSLEWPSAVGQDNKGPLVWKTAARKTWEEVLKDLEEVKIRFRTALKFDAGGPHTKVLERHILGYPVTNHQCTAFDQKARIANQMRFKVVKIGAEFVGLIVHLPCQTPSINFKFAINGNALHQLRTLEIQTWKKVHETIDTLLPNGRLA